MLVVLLPDTDTGEGMRWALVVLGLVTHQVPHCGTGAHQPFVTRSPVPANQASLSSRAAWSWSGSGPPALRQQSFPLPARSRAAAGWQLVSFGCGRTAHLMEEHPSARARRISGKRESTPGYRQIAAPSRSAIGPAEDRHGRTISERHHRIPRRRSACARGNPPRSSGVLGERRI